MFKRILATALVGCASAYAQDEITPPEADEPALASENALPPSEADSPWYSPAFLRGWTVTVGPSIKEATLDYSRADDDEYSGSMTEGMYTTYFIRVGSPYWLTQSKRWGWNIEWDYSDFHMTKQNVGIEEKDLGTEVYGYTWHIAPMGFVLFGPLPEGNPEFSFIGGLSLGLGYVQAKGDMILTEDGSNDYLEIDQSGFGINANVLMELHYWNLMSRLKFGASVLGDNGATYDAFQMAWDFGYKLQF